MRLVHHAIGVLFAVWPTAALATPTVDVGASPEVRAEIDKWVARPIVTQIAREREMTCPTSNTFFTIFGGVRHRL